MIILITGGAGFIGSHLTEALLASKENKNNSIVVIDDLSTGSFNNLKFAKNYKNFYFIKGDVVKKKTWESLLTEFDLSQIKQVYNLASYATIPRYYSEPLKTYSTNVCGLFNVLRYTPDTCKILFTSSSEVYGDPEVHPQSEEYFGNVNPFGPRSCYDEAKRGGESVLYSAKSQLGREIAIARIFNTYGPRMDISDGRIIPNLFKALFNKETFYIYGSGMSTRSYLYVSDQVNALRKLMDSGYEFPINIGGEFEITNLDLIKLFNETFNVNLKVDYGKELKDDPKVRKADITKAKKILNWEPSINLTEGLKRMYEYYKTLK